MALIGWWEIFTRNEGKSGMGRIEAKDWFYNGWYEIFKVYLHSRKRMANPLFYEDLLPILPPPFFFKFFPPLLPLHCHLQPPSWLFFLLSCFFGWIVDRTTFDVPFYLMIIWIYIYWALVPEGSWCVFVCFMQQSVKFTEFWQVMWVFTGTHSFFITYTNTQTYIAHSGPSRLTHS